MAVADPLKPNKVVQKRLLEHVRGIFTAHKQNAQGLRNKMEAIDQAYARFQGNKATREDYETVCNVFADDKIVAPIVVSEVDSMVAYLADVFLSGAPLFPVVSTPQNKKWAEQLETLVDDHATLGGYARQLLLFLQDGVKYNFSAVEVSWEQINQFSVESDYSNTTTGRKLSKEAKKFNKITRRDPYNVIWDQTVAPADVALEGDYAGYVEVLSRTKLKRLINKMTAAKEAMNVSDAMGDNNFDLVAGATHEYYTPPEVSTYTNSRRPVTNVDWVKWFGDDSKKVGPNNFEHAVLYVRLVPSDFGMIVPQPNTPQIWRLDVINSCVLIGAKRIITAFDALPMLFGQPLEDGLGIQTKSIAEGSIPFQEAATTLFNIRFAAARRAVSDRALYDPEVINPSDINAPVPAPKIPVRSSILKDRGLDAAYKQIPFDIRGTETTIQDASVITSFSRELSGLNNAQRGQFQKGNKSVQEWNDTMGAADGRLRLRALCLEHQVFIPLKETIKLNIFQYGDDAVVVSQRTGEEMEVKLAELRQHVLAFRVADGYSPKSKLASTDMLERGFNMIMNSPALQQSFGVMLPQMFAHLMQLGGVRGIEQYIPQQQTPVAPPGLEANALGMPAQSEASGTQLLPTQPQPSMPVPGMMPTVA